MKNKSDNREENKVKWATIIEEFNASGQNQTQFCKDRVIKKDLFCYHLRRWRKDNVNITSKVSFLPIEIPQEKWKLYFAKDLYLELPNNVTPDQLSVFVHYFRKAIC